MQVNGSTRPRMRHHIQPYVPRFAAVRLLDSDAHAGFGECQLVQKCPPALHVTRYQQRALFIG